MIITKPNQQFPNALAGGYEFASGDQPVEGYTVKRGLGIGGFGDVYFATTDAGKEVALKRIRRNADIEVRGTRQCLNLRHPNLVELYDVRQIDENQAWIVMEYIAGKSLRELLDQHPNGLPEYQAVAIFEQLAAGVDYLHSQGIVHRDLKPANIFVESGYVKIGDYGLSKFIATSRRAGQTDSVGTFHYMAPEIAKGDYGKQIDVYSLGILLFELLSGKVPFDGQTSQEIIVKHMTDSPDLSLVPPRFRAAINHSLAKDTTQRFSDVSKMLVALRMKSPNENGPNLDSIDEGNESLLNGSSLENARSSESIPAGLLRTAFEEPIAKSVNKVVVDLMRAWRNIRSPIVRFIVIVSAAALSFNLAGVLAGIAYWTAMLYPVYFIARYYLTARHSPEVHQLPAANPVLRGRSLAETQIASTALPERVTIEPLKPYQSPPPVQPLVRMPFKQWQTVQRASLARRSAIDRWSEWTGSVTIAGLACCVLAILGGLLALGSGRLESSVFLPLTVWMACTVWVGAAAILWISKFWETRTEDSMTLRFVQLTFGLGVGLFAFIVDHYLALPWNDVYRAMLANPSELDATSIAVHLSEKHPIYSHFYDGSRPLLPAYLSFFAMLFGGIRWWRLSDRLRRYRISLTSIVFSIVLCRLLIGLLYFPVPFAIAFTGSLALVLQLSAYWSNWHEQTSNQFSS